MKAYKEGERNFSGHDFQEFDFSNLDLRDADFSKCNLKFTGWKDANLQECDFSGSDIEWSNFERADIRGAKFVGANIAKSIINRVIVDEKTDMTRADLSWSLAFDVNWGLVKNKGAQIVTIAFSPADITEEGLKLIQGEMTGLKGISLETKMLVQFSVSRTSTKFKNLTIAEKGPVSYGIGSESGYSGVHIGGYGSSGNGSGVYGIEVNIAGYVGSNKKKSNAYGK